MDNTKVLIVDDIPLNVLLIQKMLGKFSLNIITANDGQTALDCIESENIDLVLLDLMMPGISGYDVLEKLRSEDKTKQLPVVILSALNSSDDIKKAMALGANDFITKPIIMEKLHNTVSKYINNVA